MREIKVKVSFEKCAIQKDSLRIVSGDYNSTKLVFEFDREDGIKILEMNDPEDNLLYNGVIENNEVVLVGKDEDDNPCSLFAEEGTYPFEVVLIHDGESKLTAVGGKLKITAETVAISDSVVTPELPVFDQLIERVSTALNNCEEAVEDIYNAEAESQEIISDFESNVEDYTSAFNANATNKTNDFNTNAAAKTTAFNDNAASKTETFNTNASEKTSAFNTNAAAKTAYFDSHADSIEKELASLKTTRNAIPKVSGEGTEVTLDKTAETTFEKIGLMGNCEQDGEPTPDTPQDIHVVSGDNTIKVENKNLANCGESKTITKNGITFSYDKNTQTFSYSGTATATSVYLSLSEMTFDVNALGNYRFSISNALSNFNIQITKTNVSNNGIISPGETNNPLINLDVAIPNAIMLYSTTLVVGNSYSGSFKVQVEKGSQATSYEPHKEQIKHITLPNGMELAGIGDYRDEIRRSTGKDLFDENISLQSDTNFNDDGTENINNPGWLITKDYISVKPLTTYTISGKIIPSGWSMRVIEYDEDKTITKANKQSWSNKYTFTTGASTKYVRFNLSDNESASFKYDLNTIQLEEGTQATDYEPYGVGVWYKYSAISKVVLDGTTQSFTDFRSSTSKQTLDLLAPNCYIGTYWGNQNVIRSTHFVNEGKKPADTTSKTNIIVAWDTVDKITCTFEPNKFTDLTNANAWLSSNNVLIYYVLSTPTYETITDTTLIEQLDDIYYTMTSYKGQTNISQTNNDAPFYLDVEALYDLEDLLTRVSALEG